MLRLEFLSLTGTDLNRLIVRLFSKHSYTFICLPQLDRLTIDNNNRKKIVVELIIFNYIACVEILQVIELRRLKMQLRQRIRMSFLYRILLPGNLLVLVTQI